MYINVSKERFVKLFEEYGRTDFSYEGLGALYDYFIERECDYGEEMNLDVIAICCDYTEYKNKEEVFEDFPMLRGLPSDEWYKYIFDVIIVGNGSYIISQF